MDTNTMPFGKTVDKIMMPMRDKFENASAYNREWERVNRVISDFALGLSRALGSIMTTGGKKGVE